MGPRACSPLPPRGPSSHNALTTSRAFARAATRLATAQAVPHPRQRQTPPPTAPRCARTVPLSQEASCSRLFGGRRLASPRPSSSSASLCEPGCRAANGARAPAAPATATRASATSASHGLASMLRCGRPCSHCAFCGCCGRAPLDTARAFGRCPLGGRIWSRRAHPIPGMPHKCHVQTMRPLTRHVASLHMRALLTWLPSPISTTCLAGAALGVARCLHPLPLLPPSFARGRDTRPARRPRPHGRHCAAS